MHEKAVRDVELVAVNPFDTPDDLTRLNPLSKVPTLVLDDVPFRSTARSPNRCLENRPGVKADMRIANGLQLNHPSSRRGYEIVVPRHTVAVDRICSARARQEGGCKSEFLHTFPRCP